MKSVLKIAIIGMGYVGLPLFKRISKKFPTLGYDQNKKRINELNLGIDRNVFPNERFKVTKNMIFSNSATSLSIANFYIVCVPTPVKKNNLPDLDCLIDASEQIGTYIKRGDIVFYESTVFPGVTKKCSKIIEKRSGFKQNEDFFVGYSPERINPGDTKKSIDKITKIVSFENKKIQSTVKKVYSLVSKNIIYSNKIIEAETSKVIENIQRDLNIGLFNEIFMVCRKLKINFKEVVKLASTKWNFAEYQPGLVGGHCLPVDPYYFSFLAKQNGVRTKIILAGRQVNNGMAEYAVKEIIKYSNAKIFKKKPRLLLLGATYKQNVPDLRNSLSLKVRDKLNKNNSYKYDFFDPIISDEDAKKFQIKKKVNIKKYDVIIILVNHDIFKETLKKRNANSKIFDLFQVLDEHKQ